MWLMRASFKWLLAGLLTAVWLAQACGPSLRRTYQSDNAFARCFDLDYRPGIADAEKELCWQTWLKEYVYNQPGDKVRYANLRLDELAQGISVPGPPGPPGSFDQRPALASTGPEADAGVPQGDGGPVSSPSEAKRVIASSDEGKLKRCEENCGSVFDTCQSACTTDAGVEESCAGACDKSRDACLALCRE